MHLGHAADTQWEAPGHWTFEFGGMKADLEFKRDALGLIETGRYYAKDKLCCWRCFGSMCIPELSIEDMSDTAGRLTLYTSAVYI